MKKLLAVLLVLSVVPAASAADLNLKGGTMQLGGNVAFMVDMVMPEEGDSVTGYQLNLSPSVGYFLMDNLELIGELGISMGFGDLYEKSAKGLSLGVGAKYFMPMGSMSVYFGLTLGMGFFIPDEGDTTKMLGIAVPIGILYALNEWVAIDLGLRIQYNMGLDKQGSTLNLPIGYFGVQAFF